MICHTYQGSDAGTDDAWMNKVCLSTEETGVGSKIGYRKQAEVIKLATELLKVGTWNLQTIRGPGKLDLIRNKVGVYKCDILWLSEMR